MANKPRVSVQITADSTGYTAAVNKAKAQLLDFGQASKRVHGSMVSDVQATSGALRILDGGINNNIRSAERFLASFKGLSAALQAIYPAVGMIAVGAVIARGVTQLAEFTKKVKEARAEFTASFQEMQNSARLSNDELAKTNINLENQIAKLTGKHENVLASQLMDARIEADKLAASAAKAAKEMKELLDKNQANVLALAMGSAPTGDVFGGIQNFQNLKSASQQQRDDALHNGDQKGADKAKADYEQLLKNERAYLQKQIADRTATSSMTQRVKDATGGDRMVTVQVPKMPGDQTRNLTALRGALGLNYDQSDRIGLDAQNQKDTGTLKRIEDSKNLATKEMEQYRDEFANLQASLVAGPGEEDEQFKARMLSEEALFWARKLSITRKGSDEYKEIQKQLADIDRQANQQYAQAQSEAIKLQQDRDKFIATSFGDDLDQSRSGNLGGANQGKDVFAMLQGMRESVSVAHQNADAWREAQIQIGLSAGTIDKYDAAMQTAALHQQQFTRSLEELAASRAALEKRFGPRSTASTPEAQAAYQSLDNQQSQLEGQNRIQAGQDQQSLTAATGLGAWKQSLDQFVQESRDTAAQVRDIWTSALSSVNEEIVKILSTRHNYGVRQQFGNIGAGIFRSVASAGLNKAEGTVLGAFRKADGSSSNPFHVIIAGAAASGAAGGAAVSKVAGSVSGIIGKIGGFFSGLGFAGGGMPPVNMASLVGENGPELFVPRTAGTVMPAGSFGGVTHKWHVDARGATDPAAVMAMVERGIRKAAPSLIAGSLHAQSDRNSRKPSSSR
jgi:lambda family phage tail tape measure protein